MLIRLLLLNKNFLPQIHRGISNTWINMVTQLFLKIKFSNLREKIIKKNPYVYYYIFTLN